MSRTLTVSASRAIEQWKVVLERIEITNVPKGRLSKALRNRVAERIGDNVARGIFKLRGNRSEIRLSEDELAAFLGIAVLAGLEFES